MGCGCGKSYTRRAGGMPLNSTPEPTRSGQSEGARVIRSADVHVVQSPPKPPRTTVQSPQPVPMQPAQAPIKQAPLTPVA